MFSETESQVQAGGRAHWLCASFSSYKDTAFTYDAGSQAYLVGQFGEAQMDGAYNTQVARQNVLALYIPTYILTRSVLYTAITRARELLIIVGNEETVAAMTRNDRRQRRYSGLKLRLEGKA